MQNLKLVKRNLELNGISVDNDASTTNITNITNVERDNHAISSVQRKMKKEKGSKDLGARANVRLEEIDWVAISEQHKRHSSSIQQRNTEKSPYDLVLAVDCIYNEHLVQPLVDTLAHYCPPGGRTVVWVVVELRSADVVSCVASRSVGNDLLIHYALLLPLVDGVPREVVS